MAISLLPLYGLRVGMSTDQVIALLGPPKKVRELPDGELRIHENPTGYYVAVVSSGGRVVSMDLNLDYGDELKTIMNMGEQGFTTALSPCATSIALSLALEAAPIDDATLEDLRDLALEDSPDVYVHTGRPDQMLDRLAHFLDRGLNQPGVRSHVINPRWDQTGAKIVTYVGPNPRSVRNDRVGFLWHMKDERLAVMEVGVL